MKKRLIAAVLASVTLTTTAAAFDAARPFDDVPANHWAYDAVNQPAAGKTVTWSGDLIVRNYEWDKAKDNDTTFEFFLTAGVKVNDNTNIIARFTTDEFDIVEGDADVTLDNVYVATNLGGIDVTAGRFDATVGQGLIYDEVTKGAAFAKDKFTIGVGRFDRDYDIGFLGVRDIKVGDASLGLNYARVNLKEWGVPGKSDLNIWGADLAFDVGKLGFVAQYAQSSAAGDPHAIRLDVQLGNSPFSIGYQRVKTYAVTPESALDWPYGGPRYGGDGTGGDDDALGVHDNIIGDEGVKGWDITYTKDIAKNTVFSLKYSDMKGIDSGAKEKEILTALEYKF